MASNLSLPPPPAPISLLLYVNINQLSRYYHNDPEIPYLGGIFGPSHSMFRSLAIRSSPVEMKLLESV